MFKHLELLNILCLLSMPAIHVLLFSKQVHKVVNLFEMNLSEVYNLFPFEKCTS